MKTRIAVLAEVLSGFTYTSTALGQTGTIRGQPQLRWNSNASRRYQMHYRDRLGTAGWTWLGSAVTANGAMAALTDTTTPLRAERCYRVEVLPIPRKPLSAQTNPNAQ